MSVKALPAPAETETKPAPTKMVHTIDDLIETGHGCRAAIYNEIAEGRLVAHKRGRRTVVYEEDRAAWVRSWSKAVIKPNAKRAKAAQAAA